jgi:hypothetical protein
MSENSAKRVLIIGHPDGFAVRLFNTVGVSGASRSAHCTRTLFDAATPFSLVLRRATVSGTRRVEVSLICEDVEVPPAPRTPAAHRLVLGDHSKVQIPT